MLGRIFGLFKPARRRRRFRVAGRVEYHARKEEARELVQARLAHWRSVHPFEHGDVRIKNHQRAWGSCSSKRNLNFNWRIVTLQPELIDYIILHELCHTVHMNHSADFWNLLVSVAPDAHALRTRLRGISVRG